MPMNQRLPFLVLSFLWLCALFLPAFAQETFFRQIYDEKSGSFVEVESIFSKLPATGFAPVRVTIANRKDESAEISLSCESVVGDQSRYYSGVDRSLKTQSTFRVQANARENKTVDLLVPVSSMILDSYYDTGASLEIKATGVVNQGSSMNSGGGSHAPQVLLSDSLFVTHASSLDSEFMSLIGRSSLYRSGTENFAGKFSPSKMPEDWRGYSGYDFIVLQDIDITQMSPGARSALRKWVKMGGKMRIFAAQPQSVLSSFDLDGAPNSEVRSGLGSYFVDGEKLQPDDLVDWVFKSKSGGAHIASLLTSDYSTSIWGLQGKMKDKTFNYGMFIVVLILFGVLVGPVNLFVFAKAGKRHKLFITTPIISLGASLLMIGLIFLQDGLGGNGYRVQHVHLDADGADYNSYIHQEQISRTGVLFGKRFEVTEAATMTVVPMAESSWTRVFPNMRTSQRYSTEMTEKGFTSGGDWLQSRSEQAQVLRAVVPSRARIEAKRDDTGYLMQSYFDHELAEFSFLDSEGKYWRARGVMPGKNFRCEESTETEHRALAAASVKLLGDGARQKVMATLNRKGSFIAITNQAPMVETFDNVKWIEDVSIITGMVREMNP